MKPLYPVLLLLWCFSAAAQTETKSKTNKRQSRALIPYEARLAAKVNFISLLDPETPTIQPGMEIRFNNRMSGEFSVGIPVRIHSDVRQTDSTYNRYFKIRAELRLFPFDRKNFYFAPEIAYISKERSRYDGSYRGKDGKDYGYDYAEIDKSIIAGAFKFGITVPVRKNPNWVFDWFMGVGPRFANTTIKVRNLQPDRAAWMLFNSDRDGSTGGVHFTTGVKIGYILM